MSLSPSISLSLILSSLSSFLSFSHHLPKMFPTSFKEGTMNPIHNAPEPHKLQPPPSLTHKHAVCFGRMTCTICRLIDQRPIFLTRPSERNTAWRIYADEWCGTAPATITSLIRPHPHFHTPLLIPPQSCLMGHVKREEGWYTGPKAGG